MVPSVVYETVCPACSRSFDIEPGQSEGNCPHCRAYLRFVEETEPAPPSPGPATAPSTAPPPTTQQSVEVPPPRVGEFRVACAACQRGFNVDAEAMNATCPHCLTPLQLEDQFADRGLEFPVQCPNCQTLHEVPLESSQGTCPHCNAKLAYENVYADMAPLAPPPAAPVTTPPPAPEPAPPIPEPRHFPTPRGEERREETQEPATVAPDVPVARTDPSGVPLTLDCPSCKKTFAVPKDEDEGNCPHCNVPLAFVSEKEFLALQEAEERKKQFQAKLAARRQARKEKELAKQQKKLEKEKESAAAKPIATTPPSAEAAVPTPPPKAGKKGRTEPAAPVAGAPMPPPDATPAQLTPEPRSRFAFLKRGKKEPAPQPAPAGTVEMSPIEIAVEAPPTKKAPKPAPPVASVDMEAVTIEAAPEPKKAKTQTAPPAAVLMEDFAIEAPAAAPAPQKKGKAKPAAAVVDVAPIMIEESTTAAPATVSADMEISIGEVAAAPAADPAPKKSVFGRFRREKNPPPASASSPTAVVEMGEVSFDAAPPPAAKPAKTKKSSPTPPASLEMGEISLEAAAPAAPPPPRGKKQSAPAVIVETADISIDAAAPAAATVEMGEVTMDAAPAPEAEISIDLGEPATSPPPAKKRKR